MKMSLHKRKKAAELINYYRGANWLPSADSQEDSILKAAENDNADEAVGELLVIAATLLEATRKTDPACGLKPRSHEQLLASEPAYSELLSEGEFSE